MSDMSAEGALGPYDECNLAYCEGSLDIHLCSNKAAFATSICQRS